MNLHPIQWRWHAEDLVRRRRSDEERRYTAPQRAGRVHPNPHQIEAVIFALSRLGDGGCILADEVGLGKTIEAGLVIAQLRAEGARRVLLITPKTLIGQWRQELYDLFGIETRDVTDPGALDENGVFLVGREAAGSERGQAALLGTEPFDLIVIDEAHEIQRQLLIHLAELTQRVSLRIRDRDRFAVGARLDCDAGACFDLQSARSPWAALSRVRERSSPPRSRAPSRCATVFSVWLSQPAALRAQVEELVVPTVEKLGQGRRSLRRARARGPIGLGDRERLLGRATTGMPSLRRRRDPPISYFVPAR